MSPAAAIGSGVKLDDSSRYSPPTATCNGPAGSSKTSPAMLTWATWVWVAPTAMLLPIRKVTISSVRLPSPKKLAGTQPPDVS